ncbi:MAG: hypothetical protein JSW52_05120 [Candidatus Coatesbacteria bacterium]|nr:MAG: hypothetical protein JSW52_05120 [Candidatus Coatesbacteria bacterium]
MRKNGLAITAALFTAVLALFSGCESFEGTGPPPADGCPGDSIVGDPHDTKPKLPNVVHVQDVGDFGFNPADVATVRPDIFNQGYFSLFDLLVHLDERGDINLAYHFDEDMDTHVIDSLNGEPSWWYQVWYDGGWPEQSVHRIDYYPVKDKMHISFQKVEEDYLDQRYDIWRTEVERRRANDRAIIVPEVRIRHFTDEWKFHDVEVTPHNLRYDMFREGVITAADVIMSLGDAGDITYSMLWYENIGDAEIKNYYVECINDFKHSGMCGFVYELGEEDDPAGNHIHVTPDIRVLMSPEYVYFFWIELGPCE